MKKGLLIALMASCLIFTGCGKNESGAVTTGAATEAVVAESAEAPEATVAATKAPADDSAAESTSVVTVVSSEASSEAATKAPAETVQESSYDATGALPESKPAQSGTLEAPAESSTATEPVKEEKKDYGRIFFVGDSRTVDMFDGGAEEIRDINADGMRVFARNGCQCQYMIDVVNHYGADEFDTMVTWLGCNDHFNLDLYKATYQEYLDQGKTVVICTVGPTVDEWLDEGDSKHYPNVNMVNFNQGITAWANEHGVKVIDLYTYVKNNIEIESDGIHYEPKPTTAIWNYIVSSLYN